MTSAIASLVDSAPGALDTLRELATALGNDASFSTTVTNSIASKQAQLNGTGLVRMSGTSVSYDNTTYLISNFGNIEGEHSYGYPSSDGWYKIAEVVLNSTCQSYNLWGEYRDTGYFDNSHYRIHITARAECDFPTNNESHAINGNMYGSSTNETYFNNNVRVVLTSSSSNYRKYELQYYRATWDTGSWNLQTLGWTTYTTSQTAGTPTGTARVYYISKFVADNIYAANKISIGTTYSGFAANIAGTTYVIGASVWVNDGYGISNASSGGTGFFPYSDGTLVFNSVNSEKMRIAPSGNVGIGTNSPSALLDVNGRVIVGGGLNGNAFSIATSIGTYTFNNYNLNTPSSFLITAGSSGYLSLDGYPIIFKVLGSETMRVHTSGNIGIGTDSPTHLLSLSRATQAAAYQLNINNAGGISDGNFTGIRFSQDSNAATELGNIKLHYYSTGATDLSFGTRYSPTALYIQSGGNVGIGTTGPEAKLHIVSGASQAGFLSRGTNGDTWFPYSNSQNYVRGVTNFDSGSVYFTGGNIGIGTSSPNATLQVANTTSGNAFSMIGSNSKEFVSISYLGYIRTRASDTNGANMHFADNGNTKRMEMGVDATSMNWYSDSLASHFLTFQHSTGRVGIGTTAPLFNLQVGANSGTIATTTIRLQNSYLDTNGYYGFNIDAVDNGVSGHDLRFLGRSSPTGAFSELVRIKNTGNVGIGISSPAYKLDVNGETRLGKLITTWSNSPISPSAVMYSESGYNTVFAGNGQFSTSYLALMTTGNMSYMGGNIGIGTTSPQSRLDLASPASQSTLSTLGYSANAQLNIRIPNSTGDVGQIVFTNDAAPTAGYASIGVVMTNGSGVGIGDIIMSTKSVGSDAASTERMRITSSGYVGIGTSSPGWKLHVAGESYTSGVVRIGGTNPFYFEDYGGGWYMADSSWVRTYNAKSVWVGGGLLGGDGGLTIGYGGTGSPSGGAIIAGNVGIGTSSPSTKLEVRGNMLLKGDATDGGVLTITRRYSTGAQTINFNNNHPSTNLDWTGARITSADSGNYNGYLDFAVSLGSNGSEAAGTAAVGSVMRLTKDGYVGIGTTAPATSLEVQGAANTSIQAIFQSSSSGNAAYNGGIQLGNAGSNQKSSIVHTSAGDNTLTFTSHYSGGSANKFIFAPGGTETVRFQQNGNVGIGTTDPTSQMSGTVGIGIYNALYPAVGFKNSTTAWLWYGQDSTFRMWNATFGDILTANTSGNIGIGTSSPGAKLHVVGKSIFENNMRIYPASESWAEGLSFIMPTTANWGGLRWQRQRGNSDGNWYVGFTALDSTDDLVFGANNGGSQVDNIIRLTKAGNVGVGTGSPNAKLDVAGNTRFGSGSFNVSTDQSFGSVGQYNFRDAVAIWNPNSASAPSTTAVMSIGSMTNGVSLVTTGQINASGGNSSNWNTAYGWGNHASAGYLTSETDTLASVTGRGATTSTNISVNNVKIGTDGTYGGGYSTIGFGGTTNGYNRVFGQVGTSDGLFLASATGRGIYFRVNGGSTDNVTINSSGNVAINTANFTYANGDNASVISGVVPTANKLFIDGSIQLLNNTDAIVIGRGASTFLTDEELGFGWGGGWYMIDGSYLRVRNNISVYSTGSFYGNVFYDVNDANYYGDFAGTSRLNNLYIEGGVASLYNASGYGSAAIEVRERNFGGSQDDTWATAPRIGFHWGGRIASQIALASNGRINILNDPGTANEGFQAAIIYSSGYGDSTQWNTAYSWGNHASYSYATTSYVTTQINNLVNGAPGALDTLDELAAALGDDSNFATTVTNSIATKLPLAGGTMSGTISFVNNLGTALQGTIGDNDFWRIHANSTSSNAGYLEIATSDDGTEPIYVRQYTGVFSNLTRTATLLDGAGNTAFPGNLNIGGFLTESSSIKLKENVETSEGNLEKVVNLRPVTYNKIGSQTKELGLIAEEVAEVYPEFVQYDENGEPVGVNYSRLTAALIGAVKELTQRIEILENNG